MPPTHKAREHASRRGNNPQPVPRLERKRTCSRHDTQEGVSRSFVATKKDGIVDFLPACLKTGCSPKWGEDIKSNPVADANGVLLWTQATCASKSRATTTTPGNTQGFLCLAPCTKVTVKYSCNLGLWPNSPGAWLKKCLLKHLF